jgi:hypothetical protein
LQRFGVSLLGYSKCKSLAIAWRLLLAFYIVKKLMWLECNEPGTHKEGGEIGRGQTAQELARLEF